MTLIETYLGIHSHTRVGVFPRFFIRIRHPASFPRTQLQLCSLLRGSHVSPLSTILRIATNPPTFPRLPHNPVLGGVLAFLGLFTPGILLKLALLPAYSRFREHPFVKNSLTGLNAAASGLIWTAVYSSSIYSFPPLLV